MVTKKVNKKDNSLDAIYAQLDSLKTKAEANSEIRIIYEDKFSKLEEQIGSIREQFIQREKDIEELEVKAVKASDLVKDVHPEQLLKEIKKTDYKVNIVKSIVDSYEHMNDKIFDELKDIRAIIKIFRGTKEIEKLNNDLKKELNNIVKVQSNVEKQADKVENIYSEINHAIEEFRNLRSMFNLIRIEFTKIKKDYDKTDINTKSFVNKKEFLELDKSLNLFYEDFNAKFLTFEGNEDKINEIDLIKKNLTSSSESAKARLLKLESKASKTISDYEKRILLIEQRLDSYEDIDFIKKVLVEHITKTITITEKKITNKIKFDKEVSILENKSLKADLKETNKRLNQIEKSLKKIMK